MFTAKDARDFEPIAKQERKDAQIKAITEFLESEEFTKTVQDAIRSTKSEAIIHIPKNVDREFVVEELVKNGYFVNPPDSALEYRRLSIYWRDTSNSYFDR